VQERPHFKRSALWQHQRQIAAWLQEGYSFRQIATELTRQGTPVSGRWVQEWYARNIGRRRAREPVPSTSATPPANTRDVQQDGPRGAATPGPNTSRTNPSPAPEASTVPAAPDTDFTELFQSQFKRPRK
jgi:hypothetical protein